MTRNFNSDAMKRDSILVDIIDQYRINRMDLCVLCTVDISGTSHYEHNKFDIIRDIYNSFEEGLELIPGSICTYSPLKIDIRDSFTDKEIITSYESLLTNGLITIVTKDNIEILHSEYFKYKDTMISLCDTINGIIPDLNTQDVLSHWRNSICIKSGDCVLSKRAAECLMKIRRLMYRRIISSYRASSNTRPDSYIAFVSDIDLFQNTSLSSTNMTLPLDYSSEGYYPMIFNGKEKSFPVSQWLYLNQVVEKVGYLTFYKKSLSE